MNPFTDWVTHIKAALENNKTAHLVFKILFFGINCSVLLCCELFPVINDYEPIILPAHTIAIIASIFITSFIWGSLLAAKAVWRLQLPVHIIKNIHSQKGWVLIDSLTAVLFVSVAFVALMLAYTMATKGTATATNRIQATYLAQQTLETLKPQDGTNATTITLPSIYTTTSTPPFTVSVISSPAPDIAADPVLAARLFPVQVIVTWTDSTGGPSSKNVTIAGYYYVNPS